MRTLAFILIASLLQGILSESYFTREMGKPSRDLLEEPFHQPMLSLRRVRRSFLNKVDDTSHHDSGEFTDCTIVEQGKRRYKICKNSKGQQKSYPLKLKARFRKSSRRTTAMDKGKYLE